jgi:hypothetical protein
MQSHRNSSAPSFFCPVPAPIWYKQGVTLFACVRNVALAAFIVGCPALVRANVGDDLGQLRGHYGSAKNMGGQMLFQHDGYSICVYFDGSHAAMEVFVRDGSKKDKTDITQDDIDLILAAEGVGQTWNPVQTSSGRKTWLRADGKMIARLSVDDKSSEKTLMIMVNAK